MLKNPTKLDDQRDEKRTHTSKYTGSQNSTNRAKCKFRTVRMQAVDEKYAAAAGGALCCVRAYDGMLLNVFCIFYSWYMFLI